MSEYNRPNTAYAYESGTLNQYIRKVFLLMSGALAITAGTAALGYFSFMGGGFVYKALVSFPFIAWILLIAELGVAVAMSAGITRFSTGTCRILFFLYSFLTGMTFSVLPMAYGLSTLFTAFVFAAALFVCCAIIGMTTNVDLTKFSGLFMGALLALVLMTVLSMFISVLRDSLFLGYAGLFVFLGLTAFDMQKIKQFYYGTAEGETIRANLAVYGAFQLYLDFINIFLRILSILGNRSSKN